MQFNVAVIDLGKTNSKVALVNTATAEEITVLRQATAASPIAVYPSLDEPSIAEFIVDSLRALATRFTIDAITVATHGATVALIDANGELALPVLDYEFQGVDDLRSSYNALRPSFQDTGSPALPGGLNIGAQLYWQKTMHPQQFSNVHRIVTWPQYWVFRLSGVLYNDVTSLGCHSDLYRPREKRYSTLVDKLACRSLMPPAIHSGENSGTLKPHLAKQTGIPETTGVYAGIHDSNASLVPHLINHSTPFSVVSTGTWFIAMAVGGSPVTLDERRDTLLNVNARGQSVPSARFMGGRERELLSGQTAADDQALHRLLSMDDAPGMLMPSVVQGTGPYPDATARWIGASVSEDTQLRNCAIALYLALMTNECLQLIGSDGPTYIEGPLAHDPLYAQMLHAVSRRPVLISASETGTSVGAAMLIKAPEKPPVYTQVDLDSGRRERLQRYALRWQQLLCDHCQ